MKVHDIENIMLRPLAGGAVHVLADLLYATYEPDTPLPSSALLSIPYPNGPKSLYSNWYLNFVTDSGFRQTALKRKKTPKRLFSGIYKPP